MTRSFLNRPDEPLARYGRSDGAVGNGYAFATGIAIDWSTSRLDEAVTSLRSELVLCMDRIAETLGRADYGWPDVVKVMCWIANDTYRVECEAALAERVDPDACTVTCVTVGLAGDARVELDVIAL